MPKISLKEFSTIEASIKHLKSPEQFHETFNAIKAFRPDGDVKHLAESFNNQVKRQTAEIQSQVTLLDIPHLDMLIKLYDAVVAVVQHLKSLREPPLRRIAFNADVHFYRLVAEIGDLSQNKHYAYYCEYFGEKVCARIMQYYPKLQYTQMAEEIRVHAGLETFAAGQEMDSGMQI
jgi:hypothetical protein